MLVVAYCGTAAAAGPAPKFAQGSGAVAPARNGKTEVGVTCPSTAKEKPCRGSIVLDPRRSTEERLGDDPVARRNFKLRSGRTRSYMLDLDHGADGILPDGVLRVRAELRSSGRTVADRRFALAHAERYRGHGHRKVRRLPRSNLVEYSWSWDIPAGHYRVMKRFKCPDQAPRVAPGKEYRFYWRGAKISHSASQGTGYGNFYLVIISDVFEGRPGLWLRNMLGWPEGSFWDNSVWAPLDRAGHFELSVTCTDGDRVLDSAVNTDYGNDDRKYSGWFPWRS